MRRRPLAGELLAAARQALRAGGVANPALEARLLLAAVLDRPHLEVGLAPELEVAPAAAARFTSDVAQRARRIPLQHLTGDTEFYGRRLWVEPGVLIPRPETEVVVECALRAGPAGPALDWGCGAGPIAVTLASEVPGRSVVALDLAPAAARLTARNAALHGVDRQVHTVVSDGYEALAAGARFELIVANPPYIAAADIGRLSPEVRDHDPHLALDGGADGLALMRCVVDGARRHLSPGGVLVVEMGDGQAPAVSALMRAAGFQRVEVFRDLSGRERVCIAR